MKSSGLAQHMISHKLCHSHLLKLVVCADGPFFPSPCSVSQVETFGARRPLDAPASLRQLLTNQLHSSAHGWAETNLVKMTPPWRGPEKQVIPMRILMLGILLCHDCNAGRADPEFPVCSCYCLLSRGLLEQPFWTRGTLQGEEKLKAFS